MVFSVSLRSFNFGADGIGFLQESISNETIHMVPFCILNWTRQKVFCSWCTYSHFWKVKFSLFSLHRVTLTNLAQILVDLWLKHDFDGSMEPNKGASLTRAREDHYWIGRKYQVSRKTHLNFRHLLFQWHISWISLF